MLGSSRVSLAALHDGMVARRGEDDFAQVSADLLAVASLLAAQKSLRSALADAGTAPDSRVGIASDLLRGQLSAPGYALIKDVIAARWSNDEDLVDALESLGSRAAFIQTDHDGALDRVEDELARFSRAVDASPDLQLLLTDPSVSERDKAAVIVDLVSADAAPVTTSLLAHTASHLRGRSPGVAIRALSDAAAAQRNRVLARVYAAVELTTEQRTRLAAALERLTGRSVELDVTIDPAVVGGLVVEVDDEVIDGSVSTRLAQAQRALSA